MTTIDAHIHYGDDDPALLDLMAELDLKFLNICVAQDSNGRLNVKNILNTSVVLVVQAVQQREPNKYFLRGNEVRTIFLSSRGPFHVMVIPQDEKGTGADLGLRDLHAIARRHGDRPVALRGTFGQVLYENQFGQTFFARGRTAIHFDTFGWNNETWRFSGAVQPFETYNQQDMYYAPAVPDYDFSAAPAP